MGYPCSECGQYCDGCEEDNEMTLKHMNRVTNIHHELSVEKGWWENCIDDRETAAIVLDLNKVSEQIPTKLCLIHSEVSEALESYRNKEEIEYREVDGKPCGFASELADVVIRVYDLAGAMGIDIDRVIQEKYEFNRQRPHRHGGKTC